MPEEDIDPRVEQVADIFLDLTGEIVKLGVILAELPTDQAKYVYGRYRAFLVAIDNLPVKIAAH